MIEIIIRREKTEWWKYAGMIAALIVVVFSDSIGDVLDKKYPLGKGN